MSDIRITPRSSIMSFTSSLNYVETLKQDDSGSLNLYGSGSLGRTEIFSIDGNNGRLFTVSDDLSDSLFSVNTIAGLPVIEAFANNTVVMGQYGTNALVVSGSKVGIGKTNPSYELDVNGSTRITGNIQGASMPPAGTSGGYFAITQYPDYHNSFSFYSRNDIDQDAFGVIDLTADPLNGIYFEAKNLDSSRSSLINLNYTYFTLTSGGDFYFNTKPSTTYQTSVFIKKTGEVGIGTIFPTNKLTILGADDTIPTLGTSGGKLGIFNGASGTPTYGLLQGVLGTGNSYLQVQRIDGTATAYNLLLQPNGGNVGIGTTSPNEKLTVSGKIYADPRQPVVLSGQGAPYYGTNITLASDIGSTQGANRIWSRYDGTGSGATTFERSTNSQAYNSDPQLLTYTESMRIAGNGNVGIGTSTPNAKLEVNGSILASSFVKSGGTPSQFLKADGSIDSNTYATQSWVSTNYPNQTLTLGTETEHGQSISLSNGGAGTITNYFVSSRDGSRLLTDATVYPNANARRVRFDFMNAGQGTGGSGNYMGVMTYSPWDGTTNSTGDSSYQLAFLNETGINGTGLPGLALRKGIDTTWGNFVNLLHTGNTTISYSGNTLQLLRNGNVISSTTINAGNTYTNGSNITIASNQISVVDSPVFSGNVTAIAFYEGSLRKLKDNIQPFNKSGLELVNELEIVTFDRIDGPKNKIGIIADDSPEEFLSENKDAVDLYKTVFIQAKAIQELNAKNLDLENTVNCLEDQIQNLRELITLKLTK